MPACCSAPRSLLRLRLTLRQRQALVPLRCFGNLETSLLTPSTSLPQPQSPHGASQYILQFMYNPYMVRMAIAARLVSFLPSPLSALPSDRRDCSFPEPARVSASPCSIHIGPASQPSPIPSPPPAPYTQFSTEDFKLVIEYVKTIVGNSRELTLAQAKECKASEDVVHSAMEAVGCCSGAGALVHAHFFFGPFVARPPTNHSATQRQAPPPPHPRQRARPPKAKRRSPISSARR